MKNTNKCCIVAIFICLFDPYVISEFNCQGDLKKVFRKINCFFSGLKRTSVIKNNVLRLAQRNIPFCTLVILLHKPLNVMQLLGF